MVSFDSLDEPVFKAVPKPMQTEFGIHYILESFDRQTLDFHDIISILQIMWGCILHCSVYVRVGGTILRWVG